MADVLNGKTAIICEDEAASLMQMQRILTRGGMQVLACVTLGWESIDRILAERPDVILMDIKLPDLEGTEAIKRILATYNTYRPCIIVVTAYAEEKYRKEASEAGANGFVAKPFTSDELLDAIRQAVESKECAVDPPEIPPAAQ